jgi:ubiquinone/menaquinone biosynthesis C-methylase UbiE
MMTRCSKGFESVLPQKDCRDPEILASARRRGAIDNKNTPKIYDKKYFVQREEYMLDPWRFISYAAVCMDLGARKVVDVGCGLNYLVKILKKMDVEAWGVDFSRDGDADIIADATDLYMFKDNSMDLVITTDLMEHLSEEDVHLSIREFNRIAPMQAHFICHEDMHGTSDDDYHLTLKPECWWLSTFTVAGLRETKAYEFKRARFKAPGVGQLSTNNITVFERLTHTMEEAIESSS